MSFPKLSPAALFLASLIAAPVFGQSTSITYTRDYFFPPVTLANGETAQVNVANTAKAPANGTSASCAGTISFTNASGVATGAPVQFTVSAGQISSASFPSNSAGRTAILASVQQTLALSALPFLPATPTAAPCSLVLSLEIFSGTTHVVLGSTTAIAGPLPLVGILSQEVP